MHRTLALFGDHGVTLCVNEVVVGMGLVYIILAGFAIATLLSVLSLIFLAPFSGVVVMIVFTACVLATLATLDVVLAALKAAYIRFLQVIHAWGLGLVS